MANFEVKSRRTIIDKKSGNDKSITEAFFVENATTFWGCRSKGYGLLELRVRGDSSGNI